MTPQNQTVYVYAGENAITENTANFASGTMVRTNRIYGQGTDDEIAYQTDDSTLPDTNAAQYAFCISRIMPYQSQFTLYGWGNVLTSCNTLQGQYITTARKLYYVHKDNLGSALAVTDQSGSVVQSYKYDAYGNVFVSSGT